MAGLIVALDFPSADQALSMVDDLGDGGTFYKVGLELFTRAGPPVVEELTGRGKRVFLDLKLHDIPNTVAGSVRAASELGAHLLTLHMAGGEAMLDAALQVAGETRLLGVTVLTSLAPTDMEAMWGRAITSVRDEVERLTDLAVKHRLHGVVASPIEASSIRTRVGSDFLVVTPGIRSAGADRGDQSRVATPFAAVEAGADYVVVGRPITLAADPVEALHSVLAEVNAASSTDS